MHQGEHDLPIDEGDAPRALRPGFEEGGRAAARDAAAEVPRGAGHRRVRLASSAWSRSRTCSRSWSARSRTSTTRKSRSWSRWPTASTGSRARMPVHDLGELLGVELPSAEWDTVGGLMLGLLGKIPKEGDEVRFRDLVFRAEKVQRRRVGSVAGHRAPARRGRRRARPPEDVRLRVAPAQRRLDPHPVERAVDEEQGDREEERPPGTALVRPGQRDRQLDGEQAEQRRELDDRVHRDRRRVLERDRRPCRRRRVAACSGVPFSFSSTSTIFFALSQAPPALAMKMRLEEAEERDRDQVADEEERLEEREGQRRRRRR